MNKKWLLALPLVLLLTACGEESDDDDDEDLTIYHVDEDDVTDGSIDDDGDDDDGYDIAVTADDTEYSIQGEFNDIKITGHRNIVTIEESGDIDKIVITGEGNSVTNDDMFINDVGIIIISGSSNNVRVTSADAQIVVERDGEFANTVFTAEP